MDREAPLYRRVNTRTHGVRHGWGGAYRWSRHARREDRAARGAMPSHRHGLDYTPLFRFLLARVGDDFTDIHREAVARLDRPDPIFWIVARSEAERQRFVRVSENTYWSGLFVDADNRLARVDPSLGVEAMEPSCACCTHTLDGVRFTRPYRG